MAWQKGPLPPGTYWWGAVVTENTKGGFLFADFQGDHVQTFPSDRPEGDRVEAADVLWFDNSINLPPGSKAKGRAG